jgi:hypothetical protein
MIERQQRILGQSWRFSRRVGEGEWAVVSKTLIFSPRFDEASLLQEGDERSDLARRASPAVIRAKLLQPCRRPKNPSSWMGKCPDEKESIFLNWELPAAAGNFLFAPGSSRRVREVPAAKRFHLFGLDSSRRVRIPSFWIGNFPPPSGTSFSLREVPGAFGRLLGAPAGFRALRILGAGTGDREFQRSEPGRPVGEIFL